MKIEVQRTKRKDYRIVVAAAAAAYDDDVDDDDGEIEMLGAAAFCSA